MATGKYTASDLAPAQAKGKYSAADIAPDQSSLPAGSIGPLPGVPKAPIPAGLQGPPTPTGTTPRAGTFSGTVGNVGAHLKNMVMGPLHAAFDATGDPVEQGIASGTANVPGGGLALPLYRMLAKPSVQAVQSSVEQGKKGNLFGKEEYDAQGNYTPSAFSSAVDALPIAGPWARNIETEAHQQGAVPALAGFATDALAPKVFGKGAGVALRTAGKGAQMASATLPSLKNAASRFLVPGKPGELLQSALKPGVKYGAAVDQTLESALPDILAADPATQGVSGFAKSADAAKDAAYQPYNNLIAPYRPAPGGIGPVRPGAINGTPIAEAQNASIPAINRFESPDPRISASAPAVRMRPRAVGSHAEPVPQLPSMPSVSRPTGIIASTAEKADLYRKPIPVATSDAIREDANAKLNAFYNKAGGDQNAALSNPETARIKAIGDTTRQQLYPLLESDAGLKPGTVAGMQQKFGMLSDVSDIANRREPVFARHDPVSLSQKIVSGHGNPFSMAWNYAVQKGLRSLTDSDALVNSAIDRFQNPAGTPLIPRSGFMPQMGSAIGRGLYGAGQAAGRLPLRFNPLLFSAAANPPKR